MSKFTCTTGPYCACERCERRGDRRRAMQKLKQIFTRNGVEPLQEAGTSYLPHQPFLGPTNAEYTSNDSGDGTVWIGSGGHFRTLTAAEKLSLAIQDSEAAKLLERKREIEILTRWSYGIGITLVAMNVLCLVLFMGNPWVFVPLLGAALCNIQLSSHIKRLEADL